MSYTKFKHIGICRNATGTDFKNGVKYAIYDSSENCAGSVSVSNFENDHLPKGIHHGWMSSRFVKCNIKWQGTVI